MKLELGVSIPDGYTVCLHKWTIDWDNENLEKCILCSKRRYRDE